MAVADRPSLAVVLAEHTQVMAAVTVAQGVHFLILMVAAAAPVDTLAMGVMALVHLLQTAPQVVVVVVAAAGAVITTVQQELKDPVMEGASVFLVKVLLEPVALVRLLAVVAAAARVAPVATRANLTLTAESPAHLGAAGLAAR